MPRQFPGGFLDVSGKGWLTIRRMVISTPISPDTAMQLHDVAASLGKPLELGSLEEKGVSTFIYF